VGAFSSTPAEHRLGAVLEAGIPRSLPAEVWIDRRTHLERKKTGGLFHASWGFTRDAFLSVGGYPAMQCGQDQALAARFKRAGIPAASPSDIMEHQPPGLFSCSVLQSSSSLPTHIYRWHTYPGARHISALRKDGYERRGEETIADVHRLEPCWLRDWTALASALV